MINVVASVTIDRDVEDVFDFMADFENDRRWRLEVMEIERIAGTAHRAGARYRQRIKPFVRRFTSTFEVTGFRRGAWLAFRDESRPSATTGIYSYRALPDGRTRVTFAAVLRPARALRPIGDRLARVLHSRVEYDLGKLQALLEGSEGAVAASASRAPARAAGTLARAA